MDPCQSGKRRNAQPVRLEAGEAGRKIITPEFKVEKAGKMKTIVIYTKMCRGAMTRYILKNKIPTDMGSLKVFEYEGFRLDESAGEWMFTLK